MYKFCPKLLLLPQRAQLICSPQMANITWAISLSTRAMFDGIGSLFNQNLEVNIGLGDPIDQNLCFFKKKKNRF